VACVLETPTLGTSGIIVYSFLSENNVTSTTLVQTPSDYCSIAPISANIVVTASISSSTNELQFQRWNLASSSLDSTFGSSGFYGSGIANSKSVGGLAIEADGSLLVAYSTVSSTPSIYNINIVKVAANGTATLINYVEYCFSFYYHEYCGYLH